MKPSFDLILASSSPRRRELLAEAGLVFRVVAPETPEIHQPGEMPDEYVIRNAREKACWVRDRLPAGPAVILGADTVVVQGGHILEKPDDVDHACAMLRRLSGREHEVMTGICLLVPGCGETKETTFVDTTKVFFRTVPEEHIIAYAHSGEPTDKAGAYAIQGGAASMIDRIEGSYTNVVGLPMEAVQEALGRLSVQKGKD